MAYRTVRRSLSILTLLAWVLTACTNGGHWLGDGVEAVDGFWVMDARPCDDIWCLPAREAAQVAIGDPDGAKISKASTAEWTRDYVFDDGRRNLSTTSGAIGVTMFPLILDLTDGTRRLVPLVCAKTETVPMVLSDCDVDDNGHWYNGVGNEPWLQPQPQPRL